MQKIQTRNVMLKSKEEPGKMVRFYKCDFCTKMCSHLGHLVRHKETHHNACQTCNENFENFEDLRTHCRQSAHNLVQKKAALVSKTPPKSTPQKGMNDRQLQEAFDSESGCTITDCKTGMLKGVETIRYLLDGRSKIMADKQEKVQVSSSKNETYEVTEVPDSGADDDEFLDYGLEPETDPKKHDANDRSERCRICKQVFTNRYTRLLHSKDTHSVMLKSKKEPGKMERFYTCDFCTKMCLEVSNLVRHKDKYHNACQTCNKNFEKFEDLKTHCRQSAHNLRQKDARNSAVECQICKEVLPNSNLRTSHLNDTHSVMQDLEKEPGKMVRFFKCDLCTKMYADVMGVKRHKIKHHHASVRALNESEESPPVYPCYICGRRRNSVAKLNSHIENEHKELVCNICGETCHGRLEFTRHKRSHLGISVFKCDQCPKRFTSKSGLKYHKTSHSGSWRYSCSYCEQKFTSRSQKLTHERIHTGEKPYICDVCGKAFRVLDALNRHQTCHKSATDDCIYPCLVCGKKFRAWHITQRHMRKVHKGGKIFASSVCDERFCTKAELRDHSVLHADLLKDIDNISSSDLSFKTPWEKVEAAADSKLQSSVALNQNVVYMGPSRENIVYMQPIQATHDKFKQAQVSTSLGSVALPGKDTVVYMDQGSAAHVPLSEEFNSITVPSSEAVVYMEHGISGSGGQDRVMETADNYQMTAAAAQVITKMMNENT